MRRTRGTSPTSATHAKNGKSSQNSTGHTAMLPSSQKTVSVKEQPEGVAYEKPLNFYKGWEFLLYICYGASCLLVCFSHAIAHSQVYGGKDGIYLPRLGSPSFYALGSNGIDLSDAQWREFRKFIPLLAVGGVLWSVVAWLFRKHVSERLYPSPGSVGDAAGLSSGALRLQMGLYVVLNLGAVYFAHGNDVVWLVLLALGNLAIVRVLGRSQFTLPVVWVFNAGLLFYVDRSDGFAGLFAQLGLPALGKNTGIISWGTYWKMTMLRQIAFACDYVWALRKRPVQIDTTAVGKHPALMVAQEVHRPLQEYNILAYFAYIFYLPLFVAGPLLSFNAFSAQVRVPQRTLDMRAILRMAGKLAFTLFILELSLHYIYYHAFNAFGVWKSRLGPLDVALTGFLTLNFMFTKFLIIWRIFRLWAITDGVDTPENMLRCVNNNHTFAGFWRSWHGSFNKWIVRYMYVPLGGRKTAVASVWIIFTFVGLWHDLIMKWMAWAWLNCFGLIVEMAITMLFTQHKSTAWLRAMPAWRHISAAAGASNIFLIMAANLAILHGFKDTPLFFQRAFWGDDGEGIPVFVGSWLLMFVGVNIMHEVRRLEGRGNLAKKF